MSIVGLSEFHYATLTSDDSTGVVYDTPVAVEGIINADISAGGNTDTLYADNGPYEVDSVLGEITVTLELADLSLETQAALLGHTITAGVMSEKSSDTPPYVAITFQADKASGAVRYVKLLKGKFNIPEMNTQTKNNSVNFQTGKIEGKFVQRIYDKEWRRVADTDADGYVSTTGTNWHTSIEETA